MKDQRLRELLERYNADTCIEQELVELNDWYHQLNYNNKELKWMVDEAGGEHQLAAQMFRQFKTRHLRKATPTIFKRALRVAAALFLIGTAGLLFYNNQEKPEKNPKISRKQDIFKEIKPGSDQATLTLGDGKTIVLNSAKSGQIAHQTGISIRKTPDGKLVYLFEDSKSNSASYSNTLNTLTTPRAGQYQAVLPDGTHVWLNAESSLRFPVRFTNSERKVELSGEAYFEVAKDKLKPFKVVVDGSEVKVLGTHFNISAYNNENTTTTLLEGSVLVKDSKSQESKTLKPGQQASISPTAGQIAVSAANVDEATAWINGYFIFDNKDIRSIMKLISRWYNVDVEYNLVNSTDRFGGTFSRSSNLEELLKNLELIGNVRFKIKERRIIVSDK